MRRPEPRASLDGVSKRGSLRASDADRELTVERLRKAAAEGRIVSEELEHRVTAALKARTYDELDATVADLPGPRRRQPQHPQRRSVPLWALSTIRSNPVLLLFLIPVVIVTAVMVVAAALVWAVVMLVFLILGDRCAVPGSPWRYAQRHGLRQPRRRPGGYWA